MTLTLETVVNKGIWGYIGEYYGLHIAFYIFGFVLCAAAAYLLGSINTAVIISKYKFHDDIRTHGSGNAGMTNMLRIYGKGAAAATFLGDAAKTALAILIGTLINGQPGAYVAGLAVLVGHVYPVFFGFRGGKGVVTTAVMVLCLNPIVFAVLIVIFLIIVFGTKYISLGSVVCVLIYPLLLPKFGVQDYRIIIALMQALFVVYLHRANIKRLLAGTESKVSLKKKNK